MRPLSTVLVLWCILYAAASASPLTAVWDVARMQGPWALASHVAGAALGYGHQVFMMGAKSRAIKELFEGVNEVKECLRKPQESRWRWGIGRERRTDRSGCLTGPVRAAFAFYLIRTNMHQWIWPQIYLHEEAKKGAGGVTGRVTRGMMKRIKQV